VRRSVVNPSHSVLVMTSWTESVDIWELDPKKFSGRSAECHVRSDINGVISSLKKSASQKDWAAVRLSLKFEFISNGAIFCFDYDCGKFEI